MEDLGFWGKLIFHFDINVFGVHRGNVRFVDQMTNIRYDIDIGLVNKNPFENGLSQMFVPFFVHD